MQPLTWNANRREEIGGRATDEFRIKWVNFLGPDGSWKPIDCALKEDERGFSVSDAPFSFFAPKYSDEEAHFESNCRYDIFRKENIADAPFGMRISAVGVARVRGEVFDIDGNGRGDAVIYRNAYPQWSADLIYYVKHGRAPRLEKLVRFNSRPATAPTPEFRICYTGEHTAKVEREFGSLPPERKMAVQRHLEKAGREGAKGTREAAMSGRREFLAALDVMREVVVSQTRTNRSIAVRPNGSVSDMRGVGMKDFYIWDSGEPERRKKQRIEVEFARSGDAWIIRKLIPQSFFDGAVFPVFTDTTSTFYPDPHTETTSCDGVSYYGTSGSTSWSTAHDTGTGTYGGADGLVSGTYHGNWIFYDAGNWLRISRCFLLFDTSALPDGDDISAVTLGVYFEDQDTAHDTGTNAKFYVTSSTPASNTDITAADYDQVGTTKFNAGLQNTSVTTGAINTISLNDSGIAAVSKTSITKLGMRMGYDIDNINPGYSFSDSGIGGNMRFADNSGTASDPILTVTHAPSADIASVSPVSVAISVPAVTAKNVAIASVAPVSVALSAPAVTATYAAVIAASIAAVAVTLSVPAVTATYVQVETASASPATISLSVPAVSAAYVQIETASVVPAEVAITVPAVTAKNIATASAAPVVVAVSVPAVTAQNVATASASPVGVALSVPAVTATYQAVIPAAVDPVVVSLSVTEAAATYQAVIAASVSPAAVSIAVTTASATYIQVETASVVPAGVSISIPTIAGIYVQVETAVSAPAEVSIAIPAVTAVYVYQATAIVSPAGVILSVPEPIATYIFVATASTTPVEIAISVPETTATYSSTWNAAVSPGQVSLSVPDVTATSQSVVQASASPVSVTLTIPAVTATYSSPWTADVAPVSVTLTIPGISAAYVSIRIASVSPAVVLIVVPAVTAEYDLPTQSVWISVAPNDGESVTVIVTYPSRTASSAPSKASRTAHPDWTARTVSPAYHSRTVVTL